MNSEEIRKRFLAFFEKRGHVVISSASLVPENDPSVLFTTAGMQPLVPYLLGEKHPKGKRLVNIQKCVRTQDIDEVGDNTHDTFFEMLGNWSLGDYFKKEAIEWSYQFLTSKEEGLGLDPKRLYVTVFEGDTNSPQDMEAVQVWKNVGIPENRIYYMPAKSNWWPQPKEKDDYSGPCGPDTEMFYDLTEKGLGDLTPDEYKAADDRQDVVEIWNDVFMQYEKKEGKVIGKLSQHNVDTGAGLERLSMVLQKVNNVFATDLFQPLMDKVDQFTDIDHVKARRIVADHVRTSVFMIADGVIPSNTDRGYILRRLLRRAVRYADKLQMKHGSLFWLAETVIEKYKAVYPELLSQKEIIKAEIDKEEQKFRKTLEHGLKEIKKHAVQIRDADYGDEVPGKEQVTGKELFSIFSTHGFPLEMSLEEIDVERKAEDFPPLGHTQKKQLEEEFNAEMKQHQELSRSGAGEKFKGGLAGHSDVELRYHTATHLLNSALRIVLGENVQQKGSNITPERMRFDFSHAARMTDEDKQKVENIVNEKIQAGLPVSWREVPIEEAREAGALGVFGDKYGEIVKVYTVGDEKTGIFSQELCGGPHVKNTSEIGKFKIVKEEAVSAGVRRIKAVLE